MAPFRARAVNPQKKRTAMQYTPVLGVILRLSAPARGKRRRAWRFQAVSNRVVSVSRLLEGDLARSLRQSLRGAAPRRYVQKAAEVPL